MKLETILVIVVGSILIGVLGGFATRSIWLGIGLPFVLTFLGIMWLAVRIEKPTSEEEQKTEEPKQE